MVRNEIKSAIREYLEEEMYFDFETESDDSDLFESGNIDSLGFVQWIDFLQRTYNFTFSTADIRPDTFRTVNVITDFLVSRLESEVT